MAIFNFLLNIWYVYMYDVWIGQLALYSWPISIRYGSHCFKINWNHETWLFIQRVDELRTLWGHLGKVKFNGKLFIMSPFKLLCPNLIKFWFQAVWFIWFFCPVFFLRNFLRMDWWVYPQHIQLIHADASYISFEMSKHWNDYQRYSL